jgi:hypothetical protein
MDTITLAQDTEQLELRQKLALIPNIKWLKVSWDSLGAVPSICIKVSLDPKDSWQNGIFYNGRYAIFHIHSDMKLFSNTLSSKCPKFRKCGVTDIDSIVAKLTAWAAKV